MVGFIEWACIEALRPYLNVTQKTVGTLVNVSHIAATPVGMTVRAQVELIAIEGRKLRFKVQCLDDSGPIGEGFHERAVIETDKFLGLEYEFQSFAEYHNIGILVWSPLAGGFLSGKYRPADPAIEGSGGRSRAGADRLQRGAAARGLRADPARSQLGVHLILLPRVTVGFD